MALATRRVARTVTTTLRVVGCGSGEGARLQGGKVTRQMVYGYKIVGSFSPAARRLARRATPHLMENLGCDGEISRI